ncbi:efflux RND transporter permease subunit [Glaciimonas soli]|uniref:AcrB/AcrD/AcrF family protein n=1 Tax=Glaciimonas soli TaxID=2590999 RepID=A0A843YWE3_9BURK|nr:efflux RND transporter permease subunit [Glaciimonas soli]MQR01611.1 AcrB/AcrD/AcrF family protein [Glaciimonas soli]
MNFSALSIKHPVPAILLFILLTIMGLMSFKSMIIQDQPDIELPIITITTSLPGASPSQLETEVARKIENSLATISGIRHMYTTINDGVVNIQLEFRLEKDISEAMDQTRDAINNIRADLPSDVRDPIYSKITTSGGPIVTYTVKSDQLDEAALSWFVDNDVSKALLTVPGVGKINRVGGVDREVLIELDPVRMAALNVSPAQISHQLRQVQQEAPGGKADISGARQSVRTIATVGNVAEIAALQMALPGGNIIRLDQVAKVTDGIAERTAITLLDGKPVVGFEVTRSKGASEILVSNAVHKAIAELSAKEKHVTIKEAFNQVDSVKENYDGSMSMLYEGAILAILVVWFFLRDWRATLVAAAALPLSIIPTFMVMHLFGFTLNGITLLSLALVIGILVDDAIVEIENIVRHLHMGKTPYQAAMEAADEIGLAVVATTFTLVAVFLPTAFMDGIVGKFFREFGWTAAIAVLASLVVARLLTPMMAAYLLKPIVRPEKDSRMMSTYLKVVTWCLQHRVKTAMMATAFFIASLAMIPFLPTGFIPPSDQGRTQVTLELPPGSTLEETRVSSEIARQIIMKNKNVEQVYSAIGGDEAKRSTLTILLKDMPERKDSQTKVDIQLRAALANLPGLRTTVGADGNGQEFALLLTGDDAKAIRDVTRNIERDIRTIPDLGNITSSVNLVRPEIIVTPNFAKAADLGVTAAAIGETLRIATSGDYDQSLAKLNLPERQIPIRVSLPINARQDLSVLERLSVPGKNGNVPLNAVADIHFDSGPARIDRLDRNRRVIIHVELNGHEIGEVMKKIDALPSVKNLPPNVHRGELGDAEVMKELFTGFGLAMLTGVLCVYMVLVLLFKGFLQPVTILAALPLSIGGAFAALLITHNSFSMPSLIGLLMLMGIAVKNSILLVEYAIVARRDHGLSRFDALIDACHKRAQPIIMTTIAMGAGMLPIALGFGANASFQSPMAIAVIGGLVTSTFLSLLVIPVVFTYVDDFLVWSKKKFSKKHKAAHTAVGNPSVEPS